MMEETPLIEIVLLTADHVISSHFPHLVPVDEHNKNAMNFRVINGEFIKIFGPFATIWDQGFGLLNPTRRWDFWDGYRFKTEHDAILFKLMVT